MDSSGDESFVWSRASTASSEGADDKLLEDAVKAEKGMKRKKSIKKEKPVKDEKAIKTELLEGAQSPDDEKKRVKKTRVKRESVSSAADGDTKPVVDKFSADETEVETRRPRRSTPQSADSDSGHRNDTRRRRRSTRPTTDSDSADHRNDTRRRRRSTRQSADSDSGHRNDTRRRRRSTRQSADSDSGHRNDTRRRRRSTRPTTDSDSGHRNDTRRRRRSTRPTTDSDSGHRTDTRRRRRISRRSSDTDTEHGNKKVNKSPKVSPNKPFTSKEYLSDSSASDDDNVKQNGTASDCTPLTAQVNGHRDSDSSTSSRAHKNKDRTSLSSIKSRRNTISDRIQFEDEEGSASESQQREQGERPEQANKVSSRVQRHLKANPLLKQVAVSATATAWPGPDDELWLLHTPTDFDGQTLKGTALTLDDKCKVKVDGQTYEGKSEGDRPRRVTLLTHRDGGCVIENVALVNSVRFRRKNPRPRVIEDDGHNESEAIPMPVVKRRHPLFGADYKKAIKLPSAVRKKLKAKRSSMEADVDETIEVDAVQAVQADEQEHGDKRKKRKRKKERDSDIGSAAAAAEPDHGGGGGGGGEGGGGGGKRRRKHRDTEWDSEKAIEESLFNF